MPTRIHADGKRRTTVEAISGRSLANKQKFPAGWSEGRRKMVEPTGAASFRPTGAAPLCLLPLPAAKILEERRLRGYGLAAGAEATDTPQHCRILLRTTIPKFNSDKSRKHSTPYQIILFLMLQQNQIVKSLPLWSQESSKIYNEDFNSAILRLSAHLDVV